MENTNSIISMDKHHQNKGLPRASHLQYAVLSQLSPGVTRGKTLRQRMADGGVKIQGPAFYRLMERIEQQAWVKGTYHQEIVGGQIIREREYKRTPAGDAILAQSKKFYSWGGENNG